MAGQPSAKPVIAGQSPQPHSSMARFPGHRTTWADAEWVAMDQGTDSSSGSSRVPSLLEESRLVHVCEFELRVLLAVEELGSCWEGRRKDAAGGRKAFVRVGNEPSRSGPSSSSLTASGRQLLEAGRMRINPNPHSSSIRSTSLGCSPAQNSKLKPMPFACV